MRLLSRRDSGLIVDDEQMDSGILAIIAAAVGGLIGFVTATMTSWMNLKRARLQGEQQHDNEMRRWRAEQLVSAYKALTQWLTGIFHAVEDLQLAETWRDTSAADRDQDFGDVIKRWFQGPLRMPDPVAASRVSWSHAVRHGVVKLEQQIELYIARAFERADDPDSGWLQSMYDGKDEIINAIDQIVAQMREEVYGLDATASKTQNQSVAEDRPAG
jgi:hypothetical protein